MIVKKQEAHMNKQLAINNVDSDLKGLIVLMKNTPLPLVAMTDFLTAE